MEQLISAFGIDVRLIIIQVVNFGLLMVILTYFLYKPVLKLLREREEKIAKGLAEAEAANKAMIEADQEKRSIITAANVEAEAMAQRAKDHASKTAEEMLVATQAKADEMLKAAQVRSEELKALAIKESEAEVARLAVLAAEKVLKQKNS